MIVSLLNTRLVAHESHILCDHMFGTEMRVSGDSGVLFENKIQKYKILLKNIHKL
jgi:hypothetical protein